MMASGSVYDSRDVAHHLIAKSGANGLDSLQVMKLTYISHGFVLAVYDHPLLEDDVEAWKYGPVMRRIYQRLPSGSTKINGSIWPSNNEIEDDDSRGIVDQVFDNFGHLPGLYLSSLTHKPGSPWSKTWNEYGKNAIIPQDLIHEHYKGILSSAAAAAAAGKSYLAEIF